MWVTKLIRKISGIDSVQETLRKQLEFTASCSTTARESRRVLQRLSILTDALDFSDLGHPPSRSPEFKEIESEKGYVFQIGVHKSKGIGVSKLFMSENSDCVCTCFTEWTLLAVWRGKVAVENIEDENSETSELGVRDFLELEPHTTVRISALEESWVLGVAIPAPESWPAGPYTHRERKKSDTRG